MLLGWLRFVFLPLLVALALPALVFLTAMVIRMLLGRRQADRTRQAPDEATSR
jgi:hypothetical protein